MLGHFKPRYCRLSPAARQAYQQAYCGLCANLRARFGATAALLVNHELSLVLVTLAPVISRASPSFPVFTRCPARLMLRRRKIQAAHSVQEEAAGFALLLAWLKALDWETDRPGWRATWLRGFLQGKLAGWSRDRKTDILLAEYAALTRRSRADLDIVMARSAAFSRHAVQRISRLADYSPIPGYVEVFAGAAELLPLADHLLDVWRDQRQGQFNPLLSEAGGDASALPGVIHRFQDCYRRKARELETHLHRLSGEMPLFVEIAAESLRHLSSRVAMSAAPLEGETGREKNGHRRAWDCGICDCCFSSPCGHGQAGGGDCGDCGGDCCCPLS